MHAIKLLLAVAFLASGCAMAPTYDSKLAAPMEAAKKQDIAGALRVLDATAKASDKPELLVNLERGELLRVDSRFQESLAAFELADSLVKEWEATVKSNPEQLLGQLGATVAGDMFRNYEGQDYEKVMLTTRMAMNRLSTADLDTARVDIKRTHEREAIIQEFRAKETQAAEEEAKKNGVTETAKELKGYPVETINDPEVLALKNGYQNALSHYLAGFVYEALNEPSLAAPGYRKANELRPNLPVLEEALAGLDERTSFRRPRGVTDVLFLVEAGNAPARKSLRLTIPIPTGKGVIVVPASFPTIAPNKAAPSISEVRVGDRAFATAIITDFNVMARRALKDELPGIQLRAAIRAIGKAALQNELNKKGGMYGLMGNIAAIATEAPADDRMWRFLPERVFVARGFVPPGEYMLRLPGLREEPLPIKIEGRHMIVPVRLLEAKTYYAQPPHFGVAGVVIANEKPAPAPEVTPKAKPASPKARATKPKAPPAAAKPVPEKAGSSTAGKASAREPAKSGAKAPPTKTTEPAKAADPAKPASKASSSTGGAAPAPVSTLK